MNSLTKLSLLEWVNIAGVIGGLVALVVSGVTFLNNQKADTDRAIAGSKADTDRTIAEWRLETANQKAETDRTIAAWKADTDRTLAQWKADTDRSIAELKAETARQKSETDREILDIRRQTARIEAIMSEMKADLKKTSDLLNADLSWRYLYQNDPTRKHLVPRYSPDTRTLEFVDTTSSAQQPIRKP